MISANDISTLLLTKQDFRSALMHYIEQRLANKSYGSAFFSIVRGTDKREKIKYSATSFYRTDHEKLLWVRLDYSYEYITTPRDIILWHDIIATNKVLDQIEKIAWSQGCSGLKSEIAKAKKEKENEEQEKRKQELEELLEAERQYLANKKALVYLGAGGIAALGSLIIEIGNF